MSGTSWEWVVLAGSGLGAVVTALGLFIENVRQTRGAADPSSDELRHCHEEGELARQKFERARRKRAA